MQSSANGQPKTQSASARETLRLFVRTNTPSTQKPTNSSSKVSTTADGIKDEMTIAEVRVALIGCNSPEKIKSTLQALIQKNHFDKIAQITAEIKSVIKESNPMQKLLKGVLYSDTAKETLSNYMPAVNAQSRAFPMQKPRYMNGMQHPIEILSGHYFARKIQHAQEALVNIHYAALFSKEPNKSKKVAFHINLAREHILHTKKLNIHTDLCQFIHDNAPEDLISTEKLTEFTAEKIIAYQKFSDNLQTYLNEQDDTQNKALKLNDLSAIYLKIAVIQTKLKTLKFDKTEPQLLKDEFILKVKNIFAPLMTMLELGEQAKKHHLGPGNVLYAQTQFCLYVFLGTLHAHLEEDKENKISSLISEAPSLHNTEVGLYIQAEHKDPRGVDFHQLTVHKTVLERTLESLEASRIEKTTKYERYSLREHNGFFMCEKSCVEASLLFAKFREDKVATSIQFCKERIEFITTHTNKMMENELKEQCHQRTLSM